MIAGLEKPAAAPRRLRADALATRERLVETAIIMFAERGLHGVSLREIGEQAGARNTGAVHYYFGGRRALILAALDLIIDALAVPPGDLSEASGALGTDSTFAAVASAVTAAVLPWTSLPERHVWGSAAIRLLSRMWTGEGEGFAVDIEQRLQPSIDRLAKRLTELMPGMPRTVLLKRIDFVLVTFICGMAATSYSAEAVSAGVWPEIPPETLFRMLVNYAAGGLMAPVAHGDAAFGVTPLA
jgi:AcrR family transcriptional regulator